MWSLLLGAPTKRLCHLGDRIDDLGLEPIIQRHNHITEVDDELIINEANEGDKL